MLQDSVRNKTCLENPSIMGEKKTMKPTCAGRETAEELDKSQVTPARLAIETKTETELSHLINQRLT